MTAEIYRSSAVRLEARMQLVLNDAEYNPVTSVGVDGDVTDRLEMEGSVISRDAEAVIGGTAQFVFRDVSGFNPGRHLLKPTLILRDLLTDNIVEREMGVWAMRPFVRSLRRDQQTTIDCDDLTSLLQTNLLADFNAVEGEAVGIAILRLLRAHGGGQVNLNWVPPVIPAEFDTSPSVPETDQSTYLEIINKILEISGFDRVYMTREGRLTSFAWNPVAEGDLTWDFNLDTYEWISENTETEPYTGPKYNVWKGVSTASDTLGFVIPVVRVNNDPLHPYSLRNQGGRVTAKVVEAPMGTTAGLQQYVDRVAEQDSLRYHRVNIHSGPILDIWHLDKVGVSIQHRGIAIPPESRGIVRRWELPFDYGLRDCVYTVDVGAPGLVI